MITVEVLFFEGCPNYEPTLRLVREVVAGAGGSAEIREVEIKSPEEAESLRFLGSPSVRINGCDIEPGARIESLRPWRPPGYFDQNCKWLHGKA